MISVDNSIGLLVIFSKKHGRTICIADQNKLKLAKAVAKFETMPTVKHFYNEKGTLKGYKLTRVMLRLDFTEAIEKNKSKFSLNEKTKLFSFLGLKVPAHLLTTAAPKRKPSRKR